MTPSNPASDRNEAVEQANLAYPTETRHAAQRRAAFVVGWEASRAALATERASGGLDIRKVRAVLVDVMLNDRPEDTVYSVADRIIARLAAPQPGEPWEESRGEDL